MKSEESLSLAVCRYIKLQYPDAIFTCEGSGIRVGIRAAVKMKEQRSCNGLPDLMIFEPKGAFCGLFLELKKEGAIIYKKDGVLRSDPHLFMQAKVMGRLRELGYQANFVIGFDDAIKYISQYMEQK